MNPTGECNRYKYYKFDALGNIVFTRVKISDLEVYDRMYEFDNNGIHYSVSSVGENYKRQKVSVKIGRNKFKSTFYKNGDYNFEFIETISSGGQEIKKETWKGDSLTETEVSTYRNDKLLRSETMTDHVYCVDYYYSEKGFLDSIVSYTNNTQVGRTEFINNEQGDPIEYICIDGGNVIQKARLSYEYDKVGNWIKCVFMSQQPYHTMAKREIKY